MSKTGAVMFFDTRGSDDTYRRLLVQVAKTQRDLLGKSFSWKERLEIEIPCKRGLFGRKPKPDPVQGQLLAQLGSLKEQLKRYREDRGYTSGLFWWSLPWEQVEAWLICDLAQPKEEGRWRYAEELHLVGEDGIYLLCMKEEGHMSSFSSNSVYSVREESKYNSGERAEMVRDYNRRITRFDLMNLAMDGDRPVHSVLTGADYDSRADYYLSSEYFMTRSYLSESYAKSLYTQVETSGVTAVSHSLHYESFFQVADFHLSGDGTLDHMGVRNFKLIRAGGDVPGDLESRHLGRDASVVCAGFLADYDKVKRVPMALFGKEMEQGAACYEEAMQQAEIYTCLAEKISL